MNVFSNMIIKSGVIPNANELKPSQLIKALANSYNGSFSRCMLAGPEDEPLYMLKPKAIDVLKWINNKILFEMISTNIDPRMIGVRCRIACGMLNNLEKDGIIPKYINIVYHRRLIDNVKGIFSDVCTEDLPF